MLLITTTAQAARHVRVPLHQRHAVAGAAITSYNIYIYIYISLTYHYY